MKWIEATPTSTDLSPFEHDPDAGSAIAKGTQTRKRHCQADPLAQGSPQRKRLKEESHSPRAMARPQTNDDLEATPPALREVLPGGPLVVDAPPSYILPTISVGSRKRISESSTTTSGSHKRALLATLRDPIKFDLLVRLHISDKDTLGFQKLIDDLEVLAEGIGVVPAAYRDEVKHLGVSFRRSDVYYNTKDDRPLTLTQVESITEMANEYESLCETEAAWNSSVHMPLLMLASSCSQHYGRVRMRSITTARIGPSSLLPETRQGVKIPGKMVDFAIVLKSNAKLNRAFAQLNLAPGDSERSWNHTKHGPTADSPIVISIETKASGEGERKGSYQLAVWAAAHFARLQDLLTEAGRGTAPLPMLPLLFAQGAKWQFLVASKASDGITVYTGLDFGDAKTAIGVFKIIAVLLRLIDWAETSYRPWFEANAIPC